MQRRHLLAGAVASIALGRTRRGLTQIVAGRLNPAWPPALVMGTASPGGTYAVYGPVRGGLVARATGVSFAYRATEGPNENILLLDRDAIQLGMTTMGVARQAWEGSGEWTHGARLRSFRALFPMYETPFHGLALARSGIARMRDLRGRVVGIGPEGGTAGTYVPMMLPLLGIDGVRFRFGTMEDQLHELQAGRLDATVLAAGAPIPAYLAAERNAACRLLGFTPTEIARLAATLPELSRTVLPRGIYPGLEADLPTVGMFNFAICGPDLPDDLVYTAVRVVMGDPQAMRQAGPPASETVIANVRRDGFLPFHPGAARYYRERGLRLAPDLVG